MWHPGLRDRHTACVSWKPGRDCNHQLPLQPGQAHPCHLLLLFPGVQTSRVGRQGSHTLCPASRGTGGALATWSVQRRKVTGHPTVAGCPKASTPPSHKKGPHSQLLHRVIRLAMPLPLERITQGANTGHSRTPILCGLPQEHPTGNKHPSPWSHPPLGASLHELHV